jgi:hypothetical protein
MKNSDFISLPIEVEIDGVGDSVRYTVVDFDYSAYESHSGKFGKITARSINNHDELVEVLKKCVKESEMWMNEFGEPSDKEYSAAFVDAKDLLLKIERGF